MRQHLVSIFAEPNDTDRSWILWASSYTDSYVYETTERGSLKSHSACISMFCKHREHFHTCREITTAAEKRSPQQIMKNFSNSHLNTLFLKCNHHIIRQLIVSICNYSFFLLPFLLLTAGACGSGSVYGQCCQPFHTGIVLHLRNIRWTDSIECHSLNKHKMVS